MLKGDEKRINAEFGSMKYGPVACATSRESLVLNYREVSLNVRNGEYNFHINKIMKTKRSIDAKKRY